MTENMTVIFDHAKLAEEPASFRFRHWRGTVTDRLTGSVAELSRQLAALPENERLFGAMPFRRDDPGFLLRVKLDEAGEACRVGRTGPAGHIVETHEVPPGRVYMDSVASVVRRLAEPGSPLRKVVLARALDVTASQPFDLAQIDEVLGSDPAVIAYRLPLRSAEEQSHRWLVGATPELLLAKRGAVLKSHPLAGSAPRLKDPRDDRAAGKALLRSAKDLYEHRLVTESILDLLTPYCVELSASQPELSSTRTMWHLGTRIQGRLRDADTPALVLARLLHPTPAVCGTPRDGAAEEIARQERFDRGYYAGMIGWEAANGDGEWYVTLRCANLQQNRARLFAGAGIVESSIPEAELAETEAKFGAMLQALCQS